MADDLLGPLPLDRWQTMDTVRATRKAGTGPRRSHGLQKADIWAWWQQTDKQAALERQERVRRVQAKVAGGMDLDAANKAVTREMHPEWFSEERER